MATRSEALAAIKQVPNFASGYASTTIASSILQDAYFLTGQPIKTGINYQYAQFDRADGITIPDTRATGNDPYGTTLAFGGELKQGVLLPHRASTAWYDISANVTDDDLLLKLQGGVKLATQALVTGRFQRILSAASQAAGAAVDTIRCTGGSATQAVSQIQAVVQTVQRAAGGGGYANINVLFGAGAFQLFSNATSVQGRITGGATKAIPATPTEQDIARLIGFNVNVKITSAVYNSAAVGQTATPAFLLDNSIYVAAVSPSASLEDPSALKFFEGYGSFAETPMYAQSQTGMELASWNWYENIHATNANAIKLISVSAT
jgi:hypothetical protein